MRFPEVGTEPDSTALSHHVTVAGNRILPLLARGYARPETKQARLLDEEARLA